MIPLEVLVYEPEGHPACDESEDARHKPSNLLEPLTLGVIGGTVKRNDLRGALGEGDQSVSLLGGRIGRRRTLDD